LSSSYKGRVLIHLTAHQHGGIETHTFHLSHLLVRSGFSVTLVSQREFNLNDKWTASLVSAGVTIVRPPRLASRLPGHTGLPLSRVAIAFRLRKRSFEFVIGQGHGGAFRWARRFVARNGFLLWHEYWDGLPTKGDSYETYGKPPPERLSWRMRRMIESVDGIVTGCERASMNLRTVQKVQKPILVVPPLTRLQIANVVECQYDAESIINLVMVGRLGRGKGAEVIVRLWPQLNLGPACLHLFGEFEDAELKARLEIASLKAPCIKLHGKFEREDLPSILDRADLGLMLSIEEGYGLVVCEYMAAGLPFVMTDAGAAREFTRNNPDGIMVDVDPRAIAVGIREMVHRIRGQLTSRRRLAQHYADAFSFDELAAQHLAYFRDPKRFWVGSS